MWHATEKLARAFADGVRYAGVEVEMIDLAVSERSAVMTAVANSGLIAFGAPTMNNQLFPAMADVLTYVKGLKPVNKIGFAFTSNLDKIEETGLQAIENTKLNRHDENYAFSEVEKVVDSFSSRPSTESCLVPPISISIRFLIIMRSL